MKHHCNRRGANGILQLNMKLFYLPKITMFQLSPPNEQARLFALIKKLELLHKTVVNCKNGHVK